MLMTGPVFFKKRVNMRIIETREESIAARVPKYTGELL
jgi:hypothetical protein